MARPSKKPKVAYNWREEGRETIAVCRLCAAHFYGYSRNAIYPSTSSHKDTCPKVVEWREAERAKGNFVY